MFRRPNRPALSVLCVVMLLGCVAPLLAKDPPPNPNANLFKGYSVAFIPFSMDTGREATRDKVDPMLKSTFESFGFTTVMGVPVLDAVRAMLGETVAAAGADGFGILPTDSMAKVGRKLGVKYVICGNLTIKSKRIIQITGPRAKASADFRTVIVESERDRRVYSTHVQTDNQANVNGQIATIVLLGWIFTPLTGSSRTAQEGKALRNAFIKAYDPFFVQLRNAHGG
jgi:hypothetical protein